MNKIVLLGRLVKDVECRYTQAGKCVASFTLAVNRPFKGADGKNEADFIPVVLWDKTAEVVAMLKKGNACQQKDVCKFAAMTHRTEANAG